MFNLHILFNDNSKLTVLVKRFSDVTSNSPYYYYERPVDEHGRGTMLKRKDIKCIEID